MTQPPNSELPDSAPPDSAPPELDDRPPVLGSWRNIYGVVLGTLVVLVVVFSIITAVYR